MINLASTSIGEIVSGDYRTAALFSALGIAYSWRGQETLAQACKRKRLNLEDVLDKLDNLIQSPADKDFDFSYWPLDLLADYIVRKYHRYFRSRVPVIKQVLHRIVFSSGKDHPMLSQVLGLFELASVDLDRHMRKEELILFPYIKKMVPDERGLVKFEGAHFDGVRASIMKLMKDHEVEGERIEQIKAITRDFHAPQHADDAYKVAMGLLRDFDHNLRKHLHLENNILFPKALPGGVMGELVKG